jgi:hypothetical protein
MPPRSSATAFDRLAPDQRAAVELVLRQGRSYGELADLLGMPEETIRVRARGGLVSLAPDLVAPDRAGEIADWLLGQQSETHAARTRALLLSDPEAQVWAATVAEPLRLAPGGESVPELPIGPDAAKPRVNGKRARAEPRDDDAAPSAPAASGGDARADSPDPDASRGRSSRLGGAILIGAAVVLVALVLVFVFTRGDDDPPSADAPAPTATASPAASANDILLKGPAGSKAVGLMRLFQANDGTVRFALAAQGVAPNEASETYSLWFRKRDGSAQLLGDVKDPVGSNGELTSAGPGNDDVDEFPQWFASYDTILVTQDDKDAKKPGKVILSGDLPHAAQSG